MPSPPEPEKTAARRSSSRRPSSNRRPSTKRPRGGRSCGAASSARRGRWSASSLVLLLFALAYLSPYFVTWQYNELDTSAFLSPPSAEHWFGTTQNGFDMFALTMSGMQKSLIIGLLGALISTSLAAVVGVVRRLLRRQAQHRAAGAGRSAAGAAGVPHHRDPLAGVPRARRGCSSSCCWRSFTGWSPRASCAA